MKCFVCEAEIPPLADPVTVDILCSDACRRSYWEDVKKRRAEREQKAHEANQDSFGYSIRGSDHARR